MSRSKTEQPTKGNISATTPPPAGSSTATTPPLEGSITSTLTLAVERILFRTPPERVSITISFSEDAHREG